MIRELVEKNRSYRRFEENFVVEEETLRELVDLARLSATAANLQPYRFILSAQKEMNDIIFRHLSWAGYLDGWDGPAQGERPGAYIIITGDTSITANLDCGAGICCQSILLGAVEKGLGGCILGAIERDHLRKVLNIPDELQILLVIALGKPVEQIVLEDVDAKGSLEYYRDAQSVHHVPKRKLADIILSPDSFSAKD